MDEKEQPIRYRYAGGGAFHHGIPARDLTEADVKSLPKEALRVVRASVLYTRVGRGTTTKTKEQN